jgi:hypothetical protein
MSCFKSSFFVSVAVADWDYFTDFQNKVISLSNQPRQVGDTLFYSATQMS